VWVDAESRPADRIPEWDKEQRPQLLWAELLAGRNGCVSNWTGGLQTREPQLVLAQSDSKLLCQLELVRLQERRVPWLSERRRLI
jgi:hypothetical protein